MKLSVIIVNYNVKYFLEQCLSSVVAACRNIESEIIVVDNNSVDGSCKMVKEKFSNVILLENKTNFGFSKANNQAINISKGEYVLVLNPDTVVEESTFSKTISFMDAHPDAGGLGVKMIDGKGKFLPESKRGLPTPIVAFYKISGLAHLFPKSKIFGKYHLGYLDKDKIHPVEILAGAFMLLRKKTLEKTGLFDETFFMYGEDIDLSYRIIKEGYKNYYFPETRIIHYKGESTKKSSINYVIVFYNAMIIFARKHFTNKSAKLFSILIHFAIYLRAYMAIAYRFLKKIIIPLLDACVIYLGFYFLKDYWEHNILFTRGGHYPEEYILLVIPAYIFVWLLAVFLSGGYDKPFRPLKILWGIIIGTTIILVIYALLNEEFRYSRALIIIGAAWSVVAMYLMRFIFYLSGIKHYRFDSGENRNFIIVGDKEEAERVTNLLRQTSINPNFIGLVNIPETNNKGNGFIGNIYQIKEIIEIYKIDEVIFCAKNLSPQDIINKMSELKDLQVDYKIAPPESLYIIGSNSIDTSGDLYIININSISKASNKRNKRFLDIVVSMILLILTPVSIFIVKNILGYFRNIFGVLVAYRTWVGYYYNDEAFKLPRIRKSILNPADAFSKGKLDNEMISRLNMMYARDFKISNDLNIIFKGFRLLGRTSK
ncbi:MAG TPA: glycosyltransferase [Bacteroidales bacterium]|nr:glycosyltransferase [Bacteroidales bacterium]HPS16914.1 glycosyltransferase [Bacteroidales bacterium]